MARRCENCIHDKVCNMWAVDSGIPFVNADTCEHYKPAADVVPKSEVDNWYHLYHSIKEELKQEKMYHRETEKLCDRYCIESQQAKKQVAKEIFEEIEKLNRKPLPECKPVYIIKASELAELKKKYTEDEK